MVRDVIDLRASNWVPRREEVNLQSLLFYIYIMPQNSNVEFTFFFNINIKSINVYSICI